MKMFVFPHSGGFGYQYNFIKKYNFKIISEVFNYDYPRRFRDDSNAPEENNFEDRVDNATEWVINHGVEANQYVLFGHSLGAFVAYEVGLRLKNELGIEPSCVVMSSQNPPVGFEKIQDNFRKLHIDIDDFLQRLGGMTTEFSKNVESMNFYKKILSADLALIDLEKYPVFVYESEVEVGEISLDGKANVFPGMHVKIALAEGQEPEILGEGNLEEGIVAEVLTKTMTDPQGIEVRLLHGKIGRIKEILN